MAGTNLFSPVSSVADAALVDSTNVANNQGLVYFAKCTGVPATTANLYAHGCLMNRTDSGTGVAALYQNTGSSASPVWTLLDTSLPGDAASSLIDTNSLTVVDVATVASQVNHLRVTPSATGAVSANAVLLQPNGTDAAISVSLQPVGATGLVGIGLATGTGTITVGSSSGAQTVAIGAGAGVSTVNIANTTVAGANVNIASAATGNGVTDTLTIAGGNSAPAGTKVVNILTGTAGAPGGQRLTVGGSSSAFVTFNATVRSYQTVNYISAETGANNALVASLTDASGASVTVAAGLRITLQLGHTLQAGANSLNLNGAGVASIKSHLDGTTDIAAGYAATGVIELFYNGTAWLDMSQ